MAVTNDQVGKTKDLDLQRNRKNHEQQKYSWNVIVFQEKRQSGERKLNHKQDR